MSKIQFLTAGESHGHSLSSNPRYSIWIEYRYNSILIFNYHDDKKDMVEVEE